MIGLAFDINDLVTNHQFPGKSKGHIELHPQLLYTSDPVPTIGRGLLMMKRFTLAVFSLTLAAIAACPLNAGPIGLWTFSNGANLGADSSGNGYDLTLTGPGTAGFDASARGGQGAVILNGSEYFSASTFPALVPTGNSPYTVAAWINPNSTHAAYGIVGWGQYFAGDETNALRTYEGSPGGIDNYWWGNDSINIDDNIYDGNWHFVVATYDGTTRTIYIDPASGGPAVSDTPGAPDVQATDFTIGRTCFSCNDTGFGQGETFVGELSDVSIYATALTSDQVDQLQLGTPEPSTLTLLLPALFLLRRRRREKNGV
jgi:hypothetical protein